MDWIVERGVEKIPDGVSFDQACFVEPVNTCLKGIKQLRSATGRRGGDPGTGSHRSDFHHDGGANGRARLIATDTMTSRRAVARRFGADEAFDPRDDDLDRTVKSMTDGRGADLVIVAASARGIVQQAVACSRPGARILLFAQTSHQERIEVSGADICVGERAAVRLL